MVLCIQHLNTFTPGKAAAALLPASGGHFSVIHPALYVLQQHNMQPVWQFCSTFWCSSCNMSNSIWVTDSLWCSILSVEKACSPSQHNGHTDEEASIFLKATSPLFLSSYWDIALYLISRDPSVIGIDQEILTTFQKQHGMQSSLLGDMMTQKLWNSFYNKYQNNILTWI
jgi:hypothetical protein